MIADLWSTYLKSVTTRRKSGEDIVSIDDLSLTPQDVLLMMTQLKVARIAHGDDQNVDHYMDLAGYAALSGAAAINALVVSNSPPKPASSVADAVATEASKPSRPPIVAKPVENSLDAALHRDITSVNASLNKETTNG